jgi:mono/diheme cytochrome c family protein
VKKRSAVPHSIGALSLVAPVILGLGLGAALSVGGQEAEPKLDQTAASMGADMFRNYCSSCHGPQGHGDGPLAEHLRTTPPDLTRIASKHGGEFPFDDVVDSIDGGRAIGSHGSADMPAWGDALSKSGSNPDQSEVERKIQAIAHFVWSLQEQEG